MITRSWFQCLDAINNYMICLASQMMTNVSKWKIYKCQMYNIYGVLFNRISLILNCIHTLILMEKCMPLLRLKYECLHASDTRTHTHTHTSMQFEARHNIHFDQTADYDLIFHLNYYNLTLVFVVVVIFLVYSVFLFVDFFFLYLLTRCIHICLCVCFYS